MTQQARYMLLQPEGASKPYMVPDPDGNWTPFISQPTLTDEQIDATTFQHWGSNAVFAAHRAFARAIEKEIRG